MPPKKLAILINTKEKLPPSNKEWINIFLKHCLEQGILPVLIDGEDYDKLKLCDGLFIRTATHLHNYVPEMSEFMVKCGKPVMDTPDAIKRGNSKTYIFEEAERLNLPIPKTAIVTEENVNELNEFPLVLKPIWGCCSEGMILAHSKEDLKKITQYPMIAQEYVYTDYDWRIGILNHKIIYVSKYYMVKGDWRINAYEGDKIIEGDDECIRIENTPQDIKDLASVIVKESYGDGLFGVDIKEKDGKLYLMEVNDNVSIYNGSEDRLNYNIYAEIINYFKDRM